MSDIVEEMGGYMGDGSEFTQPTQDPKTTHAIDYAYPTPQASQVWDGDNPPGVTTAVSLANAPQATDPNSHKDCEQCRSEEKMQQALAQATKPVDELMDYFASYVYKDRHPIPLGACKELAEYFDRYISNQVASAVKEAHLDFSKDMQQRVGMLRQWLNEERIKDAKHFVTNEQILLWLGYETLNGVTK